MKKIAVLFNPSAAKGRALKQKDAIMRSLTKAGINMDFIITESEDHLRYLAASAAQNPGQYEALIGVGGDTTFNIIASEILKYRQDIQDAAMNPTVHIPVPSPTPNLILGMIGTGSANDITRGLGLETIANACHAITSGHIKKMDAGCVKIYKESQPFQSQTGPETLFFLGTLSLGLGVTVNRYVECYRQKRKIFSRLKPFDQLSPALYAIYNSFAQKKIPLRVELQYRDLGSGEKITLPVEFSLLVLLNTPFYANGLKLGQAKGLFDGVLDCYIINTGSFFETLGYGLHIMHRPKSTNSRKETLLHSNWYTISAPGAEIMDIQVDGEIIEGTKRIEVTMIPGCLDVFST